MTSRIKTVTIGDVKHRPRWQWSNWYKAAVRRADREERRPFYNQEEVRAQQYVQWLLKRDGKCVPKGTRGKRFIRSGVRCANRVHPETRIKAIEYLDTDLSRFTYKTIPPEASVLITVEIPNWDFQPSPNHKR
jgi:hypothetical protein